MRIGLKCGLLGYAGRFLGIFQLACVGHVADGSFGYGVGGWAYSYHSG